MKTIFGLIAGLVLAATPVLAQGLPHTGTYVGTGEWKGSDLASGQYTVTTTIGVNSLSATYHYGDNVQTWDFTMLGTGDGFFKIASGEEGSIVGEGYCFEVQCHYTAFDGKLEETLSFVDGKLYKLGSKSTGSTMIKWQEALTLQAGK